MKKIPTPKYTPARYTHRGLIIQQVGVSWIVWENYVDQASSQPWFQSLRAAGAHIDRRVAS